MINKVFIEDKSASGLSRVNPRTGLPAQTPYEWTEKQILKKTEVRINNLGVAIATRPTANGSPTVPSITEIRNFKRLHFRIDSNDPTLVTAVETELQNLKTKFPDWSFTV